VTTRRRGGWTTLDDVVGRLRRGWDRGAYLTMLANGRPFEPISVPLRGPTAAEVGADFAAAQAWVRGWDTADPRVVRVEQGRVGGRAVGTNLLPDRVWIDGYPQLWALLGVADEAELFADLLARTRADAPDIADWMAQHPMPVLSCATEWARIVATVRWIAQHGRPDMYLRHIDVPGVDTKFIERHRGILADLLDCHLPPDRVDRTQPRSELARRYGFRSKLDHVRVRLLDPADPGTFAGFTEVALRVDELAEHPLPAATVYVVENEITYLAFPPVTDAVAVFGGGYAVSRLLPLRWLADRTLAYWSDIDTHGFVMLDRLRATFPHTRSMLMDRTTLLTHESQWVREPTPVNTALRHLRPSEADLYRDLIEDLLGPAVRLEQERIRYSAILAGLAVGTS
jgi:hypothetical protein